MSSQRFINKHAQYHAHVYFKKSTLDQAIALCERAGKLFEVKVGRIHEKLVGPHPCWSCQIFFTSDVFEELISWLDTHRGTLNILVHPLTGNNLEDHTTYASWLGESEKLKLSIFQSS